MIHAIEISSNIPVDAINNMDVALRDAPEEFIIGDRHATLIDPEYHEVFELVVDPLMRHIIARETEDSPDNRGKIVKTSIFGIYVCEVPGDTIEQPKETSFVLPCAEKRFVGDLDDPSSAIDAFHRRHLTEVNRRLVIARSPYRLSESFED